MKINILRFVAIMLTVGFTAFATDSKKANCSSGLIWFTVKAGAGIVAAATPSLAQLNLCPYADNGDGMVTSADFPASRLFTQTQAQTQFGCAGVIYVCAVGYEPIPDNFEIVGGCIRPKATAPIVCKILRNTP